MDDAVIADCARMVGITYPRYSRLFATRRRSACAT